MKDMCEMDVHILVIDELLDLFLVSRWQDYLNLLISFGWSVTPWVVRIKPRCPISHLSQIHFTGLTCMPGSHRISSTCFTSFR